MDTLAAVCEQVARFAGRNRKVALLADYLRGLSDDDLGRAARFLSARPLPVTPVVISLFGDTEPPRLSIGYATLREAALAVTGWDEEIFRFSHQTVGDTGETISLLLAGHTRNLPLDLKQAESMYQKLYQARSTSEKVRLLKECFSTYRPMAIRYFIKIITGDLRIGLQEKMVEEAVAAAVGAAHDAVRDANNRAGDLERVALAARRGELHTIEARLFHPMEFMLAKPLESLDELADPEAWLIEDKYDGIRSQVHMVPGKVVLYTRGMDDATASFPEIIEAFERLPGSAVVDGEVLAWQDERALPFPVLQQRLARKRVTTQLRQLVPIVFIAYDLLYRDGKLLVECPIEERRAQLGQMFHGQPEPLLVSRQYVAASRGEVDRLFEEARVRGNEGLVLKRRGGVYEPGRRTGTWLKLKRPFATLDVVITAAEHGHGRRATVLSDYTFGVRDGERFVNVGKAYSGLTDEEIRELTRLLRAAAVERHAHVLLVRPEIVLEVAFDGVQKSPRHKSGFALRFPRILRWRRDKKPGECDTLDRVRELYESVLNLTAGREETPDRN